MRSPLPLLLTIVAVALVACAGCDAHRLDAAPRLVTATLPSTPPTIAVTTTSEGSGHTVAPRAGRSRPAAIRAAGPTGDLSTLLDRLAMCESGMNPRAVGGRGRFFGAFQDTLATWHNIGGTGNPIDYDYATQKALNARIPVSSWHTQFPVCSRRIGV